ncbi:MAG TPA: phosphoenolpyruvate synthase, partial [Herpetosiphonaceae bacterium]
MTSYVLGFCEIDKTKITVAGGKGANLGELAQLEGIRVPDGFCITTEAYKSVIGQESSLHGLLDQLALLRADDRGRISELSREIREIIEHIAIPEAVAAEIVASIADRGADDAYAVRSSATAEDLPAASFAGQQDTYLNIRGTQEILRHVSKCWASLFTERAVTYRLRNGFDHRSVYLAVVVQKMVFPQASGILFTADPVTGDRNVTSIDASFGLGEALVAGLVNADNYRVRDETIIDKNISAKKLAIDGLAGGGTQIREIEPALQQRQALADNQIVRLARLGRAIEAHFGAPQDIEWCLADDHLYILQSRPITTLYPIPQANDQENHVYVSVGHQQMMTDAMKPLGLSVWRLTAARPMFEAGGRLFVDITPELASPAKRAVFVNVLGKNDPLIKDALTSILERGDFIKTVPDEPPPAAPITGKPSGPMAHFQAQIDYDPTIVADLIKANQSEIEDLRQTIQAKSGADLFDYILEDMQRLRKSISDPRSFGVFMTAMNASSWVNEKMEEWLGEKNAADTLSQSVPHNITSEMGLALLDVADAIRPYPEIIEYLRNAQDDQFLDGLLAFEGGGDARAAIEAYLAKYGMRCVGEIDITKTRWSEKPSVLIPLILSNIKNFEPGASKRKFERGLQEALHKEQDLLDRLKRLPDGEEKASETKRFIELIRQYIGYREYPKYGIVSRYFIYKQALLKEAERLAQEGVLRQKEDIFYLTFDEFREVARTATLDQPMIDERKEAFAAYEKLTPPRVMTSDGEMIAGKYKRENL